MVSSSPSSVTRLRALRRSWGPIAAAVCLIGLFSLLAGEVSEAETMWLDGRVLQLAQSLRQHHPEFADVMRELSGLGSTIVLTMLTVTTAGYLWSSGRIAKAAVLCAAMVSGAIAMSALKLYFGRVRPDLAMAAFAQDGMSYPSGHATMSAIFFLTVGTLLAQMHSSARVRAYLIGVAGLLSLSIGFSRMALGVHWATDVLGGWAFGVGWAFLWLRATRSLSEASPST